MTPKSAGLLFILLGFLSIRLNAQNKPFTIRDLDSLHSLNARKPGSVTNNFQHSPGPTQNFQQKEHTSILTYPGTLSTLSAPCYDTAKRNFLRKDSVTFYNGDPVRTADGNLLVPGVMNIQKNNSYSSKAFLMKTDFRGNVIWMKTYDSTNHNKYSYISYYQVLELQDGNILLAGNTNNLVTGNDDLILTRVDASGNLVWSRIFKCKFWGNGNGSPDYYYVQQMKQDPWTGDVYICGPLWVKGRTLIKLDIITGDIKWSKAYNYYWASFDHAFGVHIKQNEILYFGRFTTNNNSFVNIHRINKVTGDTIQSRSLKNIDILGTKVEFLGTDQLMVTSQGNYLLGGKCYGNWQYQWNGLTPFYQAAVLELDSNLNFVRAYAFKNIYESNSYNTRVHFFPDGSGLVSMLKYISGYTADMIYLQFREGQLLKQRIKHYSNEGMPSEPRAVKTTSGGDLMVRLLGDSIAGKNRNEFLEIYPSDTSSFCFGLDDLGSSVYPFTYVPYNISHLTSIDTTIFIENPVKTITTESNTAIRIPGCEQVSYCDSLSLEASAHSICVTDSLIVTLHKNKECGSKVQFSWNPAAPVIATYLTDSTVQFNFSAAWTGYIKGSLDGCETLKDSVFITALPSQGPVNLGADTVICPSNTLLLNAYSGYANYVWQNGSTDSIFTVTEPGTYHVRVQDACGGFFYDTIIVAPHPPIAFDAGPDRTVCDNDTLHLQAPSGFFNYQWSNPYFINSLTSQNVVVNPLTDTAYYIQAEKTAGCFVYDTIRITVNYSVPVYLGPDVSFCNGDSAGFNAGSSFANYSWNTGATTPTLTVNTAGTFSVIATTAEGCLSFDTVKVTSVFANPVVNLDKGTAICAGSTKVLDAGNFSSYEWSTGETSRNLPVTDIGTYIVEVTNSNGCKGRDTTYITTLLHLPSGFLPADTAICSYSSIGLRTMNPYAEYLWSTGSASPEISVSLPGTYWLQVTDQNNCVGRDTMIVHPKECMQGFYIPDAFTPNGDNLNDVFRPLLFGNVKKYRFAIYNRWGQLIFQTTNVSAGWNGRFGSALQSTGAYVWTCSYQLEGGAEKIEKGTVLLVR